jgi:N utilization substance protein A
MDSRVDAVGACVGIRGSRIKNIVEEVAGEKIDIVRYNESPQVFIANALKPAEVKEILLNRDINRATVLVAEDQLSLAIGKKGQNVRLAARLSGWNIDILTPGEYEQQRAKAIEQLTSLPAVGADLARDLVALGYISLADFAEAEPETLARVSGLGADQAQQVIAQAATLVAESEVRAAEARAAEAAAAEEGAAAEGAATEGAAAEGAAAEGAVAEGAVAEGAAAEGPEAAIAVPPPDEAVTPASEPTPPTLLRPPKQPAGCEEREQPLRLRRLDEAGEATEAGPAAATEGAGPPDA